MSVLVVERCGPGTSIQDLGRQGWRRQGVSTAGAADRLALAAANALVGNSADVAAVETILAGARFRIEGGAVLLAAAGPGVTLAVDGRTVAPGVSVRAGPGQAIDLGPTRGGVHGYLAVAGGFTLRPQMGSRSVHLRSGIGGDMLMPGTRLGVTGGASGPLALPRMPEHETGPIRVMAGPQDDWFPPGTLGTLTAATWRVDARSDRMGRFLDGPRLQHHAGSMVSDGVLPGSIQVPPSGQPIVLMRDCQTTGGYPKIATAISADLDRLAQMQAGAEFRLQLVDRITAVAAAARLAAKIAGLAPQPAGGLDSARLLAENLISGVVDAHRTDG
ncbi:biotin-dependent carboxyltransferase family protein [Frigidibacter mobilis]|uniref:Allophanate hydrolase subunit 2 n=1 Tax=Frigidibacter mobilis TaxID=1335048 RepID=A0A159Z6S0_9RHOB|nr:biotin-dependent carboxyltransferase family protein [Frigidibacter mobilis]AMY71067.1 allophanate hydrolase subunit 2 [Frigidibacter mobilis]